MVENTACVRHHLYLSNNMSQEKFMVQHMLSHFKVTHFHGKIFIKQTSFTLLFAYVDFETKDVTAS